MFYAIHILDDSPIPEPESQPIKAIQDKWRYNIFFDKNTAPAVHYNKFEELQIEEIEADPTETEDPQRSHDLQQGAKLASARQQADQPKEKSDQERRQDRLESRQIARQRSATKAAKAPWKVPDKPGTEEPAFLSFKEEKAMKKKQNRKKRETEAEKATKVESRKANENVQVMPDYEIRKQQKKIDATATEDEDEDEEDDPIDEEDEISSEVDEEEILEELEEDDAEEIAKDVEAEEDPNSSRKIATDRQLVNADKMLLLRKGHRQGFSL